METILFVINIYKRNKKENKTGKKDADDQEEEKPTKKKMEERYLPYSSAVQQTKKKWAKTKIAMEAQIPTIIMQISPKSDGQYMDIHPLLVRTNFQ